MAILFSRVRRRQTGQTALLATLSLIPTLGLVGFVVDFGIANGKRIMVKTAAESAAVAAAMAAKNASNLTCGSGVTCQSSTVCPSTLSTPTDPIQAACLYAKQNGYTNGANGGRHTVRIAAGTTGSPVSGVSPSYWIQATVSENSPTLFSAMLGKMNSTVTANAVAGVFSTSSGGCYYVMEPTASSVTMSGGSITSNCGVYINSNSAAAITQSGGSITVTGGGKVNNVGGWIHSGGTISPSPIVGTVQGDPFASLAAPDTTGSCVDSGASFSGGVHLLAAGKHCGSVSISGGINTFAAGTHIFMNGISVSGGTILGAGPVTLYLNAGGLSMSGATITLIAPLLGTYKGILVFVNRTNTSGISMSGGGLALTGAVYALNSTLSLSGGTFTNSTFVIDKMSVSGGTGVTVLGAALTNYTGSTVSLID